MIQIEDVIIRNLIYHQIVVDNDKPNFSDALYEYKNEEEESILKRIFLKPFLTNFTTFEFSHDIDLELNPLFKFSQAILEEDDFITQSKNICQHLKSVSKHPNIKDGDLFILKFEGIKMNNKIYDALGIYKSENKENFIETFTFNKNEPGLDFKKGIGSKRLDKACLIIFTENQFTILLIDNANIQTDYWQNEFINLRLKKDNINNTTQFLTLTKSFVTKQLPSEFDVTKADQIDLLNRSVEYFKNSDNFNKDEFEQHVLQDDSLIKSFQSFDSDYRREKDIEISDGFPISPDAVKKQERVFKTVLKLDKNFHIYIHGNRELIEHGVEKDGRKYYKIYFDQES